jgi:PAS domain S-box-containing protein
MLIDTDAAQFSRALRNAILLPIAVILLAALLAGIIGSEFLRVVERSDHSREVGRALLYCHETLLNMESSELGYQLSGEPQFLAPYTAGLAHIDSDFATVRNLLSDNRDLKAQSDQLIQAKDTWLAHAKGTVAQRQAGKIPDADWTRLGRTLREDLNARLARLMQAQLQVRDARIRDVDHMKHVFVLSCCAIAILLALAVGQLVRRQFSSLALNYRHAIHTVEQRNTALERSESDLEQQKEWFRVTLTSIGEGVIVTDKDGRIVFMNHEAEKLTGWTSVEALLSPLGSVFRVIHEQTREKMSDSVSEVFRTNQVVELGKLAVLVSRTGEEWPIDDTAAPIRGPAGETLGVVLVFHNATEIRQAQQALRIHSDELERRVNERTANLRAAVNQLETFSYTVSHDLRSPLRAMQGFALAALEDYGDKLDEQGRDYLTRIKNAAERLDRLIQDLLSYSRLGKDDAPLVDLDLDKMTREIIENYPNLHEPSAEVQVEGTLPHVWGHESALTQVIANLLGNAAKFVPPGVVARIRIWAESLGPRMRLWIEDNGIGIDPKDAERIFTMFVRVDETSHYGGTGVGLAIVKKAVEAMHGRVGVEPGPKGGSRFWVELGEVAARQVDALQYDA